MPCIPTASSGASCHVFVIYIAKIGFKVENLVINVILRLRILQRKTLILRHKYSLKRSDMGGIEQNPADACGIRVARWTSERMRPLVRYGTAGVSAGGWALRARYSSATPHYKRPYCTTICPRRQAPKATCGLCGVLDEADQLCDWLWLGPIWRTFEQLSREKWMVFIPVATSAFML